MAHDWDDFRYFLALSRASSTVEAARKLEVTHQTVSRRIAALETRLNMRLVDRDGLALRLTPRGRDLAERVAEMETLSHSIAQMARHANEKVEGRVRITTADGPLKIMVMPVLEKLMDAFPDITLDIIADTELVDVGSGFVDFAIRYTSNPDEDLIGQKVAPVAIMPVGSPALMEAFDAGARGERSLPRVPVVTFLSNGEGLPDWACDKVHPESPVHRVSNIDALITFVQAGRAVGLLPWFVATQIPGVQRSRAVATQFPIDLWLLTNAEVRRSEKLRAIRQVLFRELSALAPLVSGEAKAA
ncbi:LysR family transcriptional regulator [Pseudoruegeria sp. SHC-113]|uniref:LysR family transcriptional regulator n=1 Tax=Pseudoruegeria sp. SHC-113 TaxID=2855439 RepID=UPI0021BA7C78|nr:LysR family transcriptional regulator [Pseudoruegeria sp. SHC-113]MCT8160306.1 LysR family transcriptional regulator [Pseudoruegeria sp. SHC-113]